MAFEVVELAAAAAKTRSVPLPMITAHTQTRPASAQHPPAFGRYLVVPFAVFHALRFHGRRRFKGGGGKEDASSFFFGRRQAGARAIWVFELFLTIPARAHGLSCSETPQSKRTPTKGQCCVCMCVCVFCASNGLLFVLDFDTTPSTQTITSNRRFLCGLPMILLRNLHRRSSVL